MNVYLSSRVLELPLAPDFRYVFIVFGARPGGALLESLVPSWEHLPYPPVFTTSACGGAGMGRSLSPLGVSSFVEGFKRVTGWRVDWLVMGVDVDDVVWYVPDR